MSEEHIRRRLVLKMGGKPETVYIDKITKFLIQQEEKHKSQVLIINLSKKKEGTLEFSLENGEAYELTNYVDPRRDKPKPPDYKPPEIQVSKIEETIVEEMPDAPFTMVHFVFLSVLAGLSIASAIVVWLILTYGRAN
jgi:hypothetical protein